MAAKNVTGQRKPSQVPEVLEDWALLYQTFTSLQKLTERALLPLGLSSPQVFLMGMLYWEPTPLVPARARSTSPPIWSAMVINSVISSIE